MSPPLLKPGPQIHLRFSLVVEWANGYFVISEIDPIFPLFKERQAAEESHPWTATARTVVLLHWQLLVVVDLCDVSAAYATPHLN
jgi:hypothetical protein